MTPRSNLPRVGITGMGCVSVLGECPSTMVDGLLAGRSGITAWKSQPSTIYSKIGGDLSDFELERQLDGWPAIYAERARSTLRLSAPAGRMVAAAAFQALASAGALDLEGEDTAHILGAHNCNERFVFQQALEFAAEPEFVDPMYGVVAFDTDALAATNDVFGIRGPSFTVGGACASSNVALVTALDLLRLGRATRVLVTGAAMTTSPLALQGWAFIQALSLDTFAAEPHRASRPFDVRREGFVPSEGAGAVLLETFDAAQARGAPILVEMLGGAITSAASRGTRTDVDAQRRAIRDALADARVNGDEVDYVNAHGTSTPIGDRNEMEALRQVLGEGAAHVPVNSSKSMLGHALQAASVLELIATVGQMQRGWLHPTLNLEEVDPALADLDLVRGAPRECRVDVAMSNAFGFGGVNAVVVVGRA
jgi:3-oxoacyl-(acyl-carrier-protein) synthase